MIMEEGNVQGSWSINGYKMCLWKVILIKFLIATDRWILHTMPQTSLQCY